jgi:hypothetical protein
VSGARPVKAERLRFVSPSNLGLARIYNGNSVMRDSRYVRIASEQSVTVQVRRLALSASLHLVTNNT